MAELKEGWGKPGSCWNGKLWKCREALFGLHTEVYRVKWLTACLCHTVHEHMWGLSPAACAQCMGEAPAYPCHYGTSPGLISPAESSGAVPVWYCSWGTICSLCYRTGCVVYGHTFVPESALLPWALPVAALISGCGGFPVAFCTNKTPKCLLKQGSSHYKVNCF